MNRRIKFHYSNPDDRCISVMPEELFLDRSIKKIESYFRWMGINIRSGDNNNKKDVFKIRCIYFINFVLLNTDVLGAIFWFRSGLEQGKTFTEVTYNAPCLTFSFLANFKMLSLIFYEKTVHELITVLQKLEIKHFLRQNGVEELKILKDEKNFLHAVFKGSKIVNYASILTFGCSPLVLIASNYHKTSRMDYLLPLIVLYPFDVDNITVWPIIYVRQIWSGNYV